MKTWILVIIVAALHCAAISALLVLQGCATPDAREERRRVEALPELPPVLEPDPMPPVAVPAEPDTKTYTVREGDSVSLIAHRYNVSQSEILALNRLDDPDKIRVGQTLILPGYVDLDKPARVPAPAAPETIDGNIYVVQPNDTLSGIASRLNVSEADLIRLNELRDPDRIIVGQKLALPDDAVAPPEVDDDPRPPRRPEKKVDPVPVDEDPAEAEQVATIIHPVLPGETLESIASLYVLSVSELASFNNLPEDTELLPGQRLVIP